jgi:hypothetical protein
MAINPADVLLGALPGAGGAGVSDEIVTLTQQLRQLQTTSQIVAQSLADNTRAVETNTSSRGVDVAANVGRTLQSVLGFGTGLSPLITGVLSLFGRAESKAEPPPLVKYSLPSPLDVTGGVSSAAPGQAFAIDYGQGGQPRAVSNASAPAGAQITVNVQTMDSRSFLDHSNDIALAVRQAMLESSVLTDVVRDV